MCNFYIFFLFNCVVFLQLTAADAREIGLVTEVFPDASFQETVWPRVQAYAKLPPQSLAYGKALYRKPLKEALKKVN